MGLKAGGSFVLSENWNPDGVAHAQKALGGWWRWNPGPGLQGLADALLKPKASSMSRKCLGLDLILLLSQTPPISDLQEWNEPFTGNGLPGDTAVH